MEKDLSEEMNSVFQDSFISREVPGNTVIQKLKLVSKKLAVLVKGR